MGLGTDFGDIMGVIGISIYTLQVRVVVWGIFEATLGVTKGSLYH